MDDIPLASRAELLAQLFGLTGDRLLPRHLEWIAGTARADDWITKWAKVDGDRVKAAVDWLDAASQ